jgi:hypothetical protein
MYMHSCTVLYHARRPVQGPAGTHAHHARSSTYAGTQGLARYTALVDLCKHSHTPPSSTYAGTGRYTVLVDLYRHSRTPPSWTYAGIPNVSYIIPNVSPMYPQCIPNVSPMYPQCILHYQEIFEIR